MAYEGSVGTYIEVSAASPATEDQAGYEALSWTKVAGVTTLGEFSKIWQMATAILLETGLTEKRKSSFDNGSLPVQMLRDTSDAGQGILAAASDSPTAIISIKIVEPDGTINYAQAIILSHTVNTQSASDMKTANSQIEITSDIIVV